MYLVWRVLEGSVGAQALHNWLVRFSVDFLRASDNSAGSFLKTEVELEIEVAALLVCEIFLLLQEGNALQSITRTEMHVDK